MVIQAIQSLVMGNIGTLTVESERLLAGTVGLLLLALAPDYCLAQAANEWRDPAHLYESTCRYCHETNVGPVLKGRSLPVDYIRDRVRKGFGPMPAFKPSELSDADLQALGEWLMGSAAPAAGPD